MRVSGRWDLMGSMRLLSTYLMRYSREEVDAIPMLDE
jgi:hypothetical protein